jgi:uncharacterized protein involved in exopolysaccharide biosynthesis
MAEGGEDDTRRRMARYREVVLRYEQLGAQIDSVLGQQRQEGAQIGEAERAQYRVLARQRDELADELRVLEQQLLGDEATSDDPGATDAGETDQA